jgi:hypothetical protein
LPPDEVKPPARILVPAGPRRGNAQAVAYATALATALDAELVLLGPAGPAIVDAARERSADLVVVPNGKGGGFAHLLRRSAAREVVQQCAVPILLVPAADVAPRRAPDVHPLLDALAAGRALVDEGKTGDDVVVLHWPRRGALGHLLPHHAAWHALKRSPLPVLVVPASAR